MMVIFFIKKSTLDGVEVVQQLRFSSPGLSWPPKMRALTNGSSARYCNHRDTTSFYTHRQSSTIIEVEQRQSPD